LSVAAGKIVPHRDDPLSWSRLEEDSPMTSHDQVLSGSDDRPIGALVGGRSLALTRAATVLITFGIGAASFVLSFAALRHLASRAGIPGQLAWLWPMIVDGTILQATMAVVALAGHRDQHRSRRYFWIVLSSSAAVSVGANALHAVIPGSMPLSPWLAAAIAVVAPVSLLATTHGLSLLIRVPRHPDAVWLPVELAHDEGAHDGSMVSPSRPTIAVTDPTEHTEHQIAPVAVAALQPWESLAEVIASREGAKDFAVAEIASVLHLSYERELPHQVVARHLGIDHRTVSEIVSASSELLRSRDVSVERVAV
jgi:uncharacterized membrane protein YidH (DUF202 family)